MIYILFIQENSKEFSILVIPNEDGFILKLLQLNGQFKEFSFILLMQL